MVAASLLLACHTAALHEPQFAQAPAVERGTNGFVIRFAASTTCDVTVSVVDTNSVAIRHLVSGMLGPHAPEPLRANSLAQELCWDGTDDRGRPVTSGEVLSAGIQPLRVRVSLGLTPVFTRMLGEVQPGVGSRGPLGIALDKNGLLYVEEGDNYRQRCGFAGALQRLDIKVFDRDGNYLRTLTPFRGDWPDEKVSAVDFVTTRDGRRVPVARSGGNISYGGFLPGAVETVGNTPVITSGGTLLYPSSTATPGCRRLLRMGIDGSARRATFLGPPMQGNARGNAPSFLALSPDEREIYFAGAQGKGVDGQTSLLHAVYRTTLDATNAARPFLGQELHSGAGEGEFNDPRGIAVDAAGRIWVCDYRNDRIQVFEATGRFLKALPVRGPHALRLHPQTGAAYVLSVSDRGATRSSYGVTWEVYAEKAVVKFASLDDWRELARLPLPKRSCSMHDPGPMLALDATRDPAALWIVHFGAAEDFLWKAVDRGSTLERVSHRLAALRGHAGAPGPIAADRRNNRLLLRDTLVDPRTGATRKVDLAGEPGQAALAELGDVAVDRAGLLYYRSAIGVPGTEDKRWRIRRFNTAGRLVPFDKAGEFLEANANWAHTGFNFQSTTFALGPDGRIYVVAAVPRPERRVLVDVYAPDGGLVTTSLVVMSKSAGCFRIDGCGRLFASDTLRPRDRAIPEWYDSDPSNIFARWYGSVFRLDPSGGGVVYTDDPADPFLAGGMLEKLRPARLAGARWTFYGLSPVPLQTSCQCATGITRFDADDWGRTWIPDAIGSCVAVLDCAGNLMTRLGAYGNRDNTGAGSPVPEPGIPLGYPFDLAALDSDVFIRDLLGCRIVQVRLAYKAEALAPLPD